MPKIGSPSSSVNLSLSNHERYVHGAKTGIALMSRNLVSKALNSQDGHSDTRDQGPCVEDLKRKRPDHDNVWPT
ncbi:hypothetical protein N7516_008607 [Penicillium verrucosum]|uniref:uncharacterized protein n=1 Tax=Penicillium verrucosum TaxID=60171 RepID=UPI002545B688|nr:uncharacterized protein N7516_008607 [Penicillium verrucosum]KAJ5926834.1 hypothetical protein N7516_008607 [Penicillium verrucosum]